MRKCEAVPGDRYSGLRLRTDIDAPDCEISLGSAATQQLHITNYSLLTWEIDFISSCPGTHLAYGPEAGASNTWSGSITVPFRFGTGPRRSACQVSLYAFSDPAVDQEVHLSAVCNPTGYSRVGPFAMVLQVDVLADPANPTSQSGGSRGTQEE